MTRVSLAEVARRSGVSVATASRVLNPHNDHPVSAELRERVLRTAEEFNYSVNALARGLKMLRTQTVAILVHDIRDPYFSECTRGVADAADAAGYLTVVCNSDRDPDKELRYVQLAYEQRVAGILFAGSGCAGAGYRVQLKRQVAALEGYGAHAIALSPRRDRLPAEVPDNVGGAHRATEHLLELGHERIAFIDGPAGLETSRERLAGYRDALERAGLELDESLVVRGDFSVTGGGEALGALLDSGRRPTAVLASNDAMAIGCLDELRCRGLRVPRDVSLVGFDDIPAVRWLDPPLTTVAVPMAEIGAAGMRRLLALLESNGAQPRRERLVHVHPTELVVRGSTAPPE
jgi:LacI family transcriptional regulator